MWRILVVEDGPNTRDQLVKTLQEAIPSAELHGAGSVSEALQLVGEAVANGLPYHVAVLDFRLPPVPGEHPEMDESVCEEVARSMPNACIVHFTGYATDAEVQREMAQAHGHNRPDRPRCQLIQKGPDPEGIDAVLASILDFLDGLRRNQVRARVAASLDRVFGPTEPQSGDRGVAARRQPGAAVGSLTHELMALSYDIEQSWADLDGSLRARIGRYFDVEESKDRIAVVLR